MRRVADRGSTQKPKAGACDTGCQQERSVAAVTVETREPMLARPPRLVQGVARAALKEKDDAKG